MLKSLWNGVSGMRSEQVGMDVIGNNIANVNTTAFKTGRVHFQDVMSKAIRGNGAGGINSINPSQIGLGTEVASIDNIFRQGGFSTTDRVTDLAIDGNGFFIVAKEMKAVTGDNFSSQAEYYYTRDGSFYIDDDGYLVNSNGMYVVGVEKTSWGGYITKPIDLTPPVYTMEGSQIILSSTKNIDTSSAKSIKFTLEDGTEKEITLPTAVTYDGSIGRTLSDLAKAIQTQIDKDTDLLNADLKVRANDANNALIFTSNQKVILNTGTSADLLASIGFNGGDTLSEEFYSAEGSQVNLSPTTSINTTTYSTMGFTLADGTSDTITVAGVNYDGSTGKTLYDLATDIQGKIDADTTLKDAGIRVHVNAAGDALVFTAPQQVTLNAGSSANDLLSKIGYSNGYVLSPKSNQIESLKIDDMGNIFVNGNLTPTATIGLDNYSNPENLTKQGQNLYKVPNNSSGSADLSNVTFPGNSDKGTGLVKSGKLEMSNVDLTNEMTNMIVTQRGYQANARVITVSDTLLEELINLKR